MQMFNETNAHASAMSSSFAPRRLETRGRLGRKTYIGLRFAEQTIEKVGFRASRCDSRRVALERQRRSELTLVGSLHGWAGHTIGERRHDDPRVHLYCTDCCGFNCDRTYGEPLAAKQTLEALNGVMTSTQGLDC